MSLLDDFMLDQRELLVSLPFRTGLLISFCDESGGDEAQEAEMQVLESLITGFAEDFLKSEFVEQLMRETMQNQDKWEEWSEDLEATPRQCRQAVEILHERLDSKEVLAFRQNLMEIAMSVALAYRETDDGDAPAPSFFSEYWGRFMARLKKETPSRADSLHISPAERKVLLELSDALRIDLDGNPIESAAAA